MAVYEIDNFQPPPFYLFKFQEAPPRLLPSLPTAGKKDVTLTQKDAENQSRLVIGSAVSSLRSKEVSSSKVCGNVYWFFFQPYKTF